MLANGIVVADWLFTPSNSERVVRALIPRLLLTKERVLNISFEIANALSPSSLGGSRDTRKLGVGVKRLKIEAWAPPASTGPYADLSFRRAVDNGSYLAAGWSSSGEAGIIAQDRMASLMVPLPQGPLSHLSMAIDARLVDRSGRDCAIDVFANGHVVGQIKTAASGTTRFDLPSDLLPAGEPLFIVFKEAETLGSNLERCTLKRPLPLLLQGMQVNWTLQ
jgi:hypothetical protein